MILEWSALHQQELLSDWELCKAMRDRIPLSHWSDPMLFEIEHIRVYPERYTVDISYTDKVTVRADFKALMDQGGVAEALKDTRVFATARIGPRGRTLVFRDDIEFCADGLRMKSKQTIEDAA
jgi:hypothetical protein